MAGLRYIALTGSIAKQNVLNGGITVDQLTRPTPFLAWLEGNGMVVHEGEPFRVNMRTATNAAASFSEGDAISSFVADSYNQTVIPARSWRQPFEIGGRTRDANNNGGFYEDILKGEINSAILQVRKAQEVDLLGSTVNVGLSSIVDSTALYGGLDPASVTSHASYVDSSGGILTVSKLEDLEMNLRGSTYGADNLDFIVATFNQTRNYMRVATPGVSSLSPSRFVLDGKTPFDAGISHLGASFNGMDWVTVHDLTNTELVMGDSKQLQLALSRDMEVRPLGPVNDDDRYQISSAGALVCKRRRSFGRLTGLSV
jgi:hypothetical protein